MLYVCQLDHADIPYPTHTDTPDNEYGKNSTMRSSGCGLCSSVMMADRLLINPNFGLKDALELSFATGANHGSGTDYKLYAPALAERLGLDLEVTSDIDKLAECLKTGGCAIAHVRPHADGEKPYFSHNGGHYVTVISVESDGCFDVLDPSNRPGKFDDPYRSEMVKMKDGIAVCKPEALVKDVEMLEGRGFYLFKRK